MSRITATLKPRVATVLVVALTAVLGAPSQGAACTVVGSAKMKALFTTPTVT